MITECLFWNYHNMNLQRSDFIKNMPKNALQLQILNSFNQFFSYRVQSVMCDTKHQKNQCKNGTRYYHNKATKSN